MLKALYPGCLTPHAPCLQAIAPCALLCSLCWPGLQSALAQACASAGLSAFAASATANIGSVMMQGGDKALLQRADMWYDSEPYSSGVCRTPYTPAATTVAHK